MRAFWRSASPPQPPPPAPPLALFFDAIASADSALVAKTCAIAIVLVAAVFFLFESYTHNRLSIGASRARRYQALAVASFSLYSLVPYILISFGTAAYCLAYSRYTAVPMAAYLVWIFAIDRSATSGARRPCIRNSRFWHHYARPNRALTLNLTLNLTLTTDPDPDPDANPAQALLRRLLPDHARQDG